jgi:hypothetical protein
MLIRLLVDFDVPKVVANELPLQGFDGVFNVQNIPCLHTIPVDKGLSAVPAVPAIVALHLTTVKLEAMQASFAVRHRACDL